MYKATGKRILDVVLSAIALVILLAPMAVIACAVYVAMGGPILFRSRRPGLHGEPFTLHKFRTMSDATTVPGALEIDRITRLGRFLRRTSLDELPEFWDVLCGAISLVGPRPLLAEYLPRYTAEQARRHEVRPGLTGWAQVKGRNTLSWEQKFTYDVWYVDHCSFVLDIRVLWKTIGVVLSGRGVDQDERTTAEAFQGTESSDSRQEWSSPG